MCARRCKEGKAFSLSDDFYLSEEEQDKNSCSRLIFCWFFVDLCYTGLNYAGRYFLLTP